MRLVGHEVLQGRAGGDFGGDEAGHVRLGNVDIHELGHRSDLRGQIAAEIGILVEIEVLHLGPLAEQHRIEGSRELVVREIQVFQLGETVQRVRDVAAHLAVDEAEVGEFAEVGDVGRDGPGSGDGTLQELEGGNAAGLIQGDAVPFVDWFREVPGTVGMPVFGAAGRVENGHQGEGVGAVAERQRILGDGHGLLSVADGLLDGDDGVADGADVAGGDGHHDLAVALAAGGIDRDPAASFRDGDGPGGVGSDREFLGAAFRGEGDGEGIDIQGRSGGRLADLDGGFLVLGGEGDLDRTGLEVRVGSNGESHFLVAFSGGGIRGDPVGTGRNGNGPGSVGSDVHARRTAGRIDLQGGGADEDGRGEGELAHLDRGGLVIGLDCDGRGAGLERLVLGHGDLEGAVAGAGSGGDGHPGLRAGDGPVVIGSDADGLLQCAGRLEIGGQVGQGKHGFHGLRAREYHQSGSEGHQGFEEG